MLCGLIVMRLSTWIEGVVEGGVIVHNYEVEKFVCGGNEVLVLSELSICWPATLGEMFLELSN